MKAPSDRVDAPSQSSDQVTHCDVYQLGTVRYQQAWDLQAHLAEAIGRGQRPPALLLLEHPHTFTFGRSGKADNLLWSQGDLEQHGIDLHWVDRGGDVTYHGPGQLVGYPLLPLGRVDRHGRLPQPDYVGYLRRLEEVLILTLADFGLMAGQLEGLTGVWVDTASASSSQAHVPAKIAAIGVKVDVRGVSRHGFALNVDPDMKYWRGIVPCGIDDYGVTSLAEQLGRPISLAEVIPPLRARFRQVFQVELRSQPESKLITAPSA